MRMKNDEELSPSWIETFCHFVFLNSSVLNVHSHFSHFSSPSASVFASIDLKLVTVQLLVVVFTAVLIRWMFLNIKSVVLCPTS